MKVLHGGPKLTESIFRQRYWITKSQNTIKTILNQSVDCFRVSPKPMEPKTRVNAVTKPFFNTAVD